MWHIYMMECYLAVKKNDIMKISSQWMENKTSLSLVTQTEKDKHDMYSFILDISC